MKAQKERMATVTIPKWLYDSLIKDSELVRHLTHYKGYGWIQAVRKEMESDKQFDKGAFKNIFDIKHS
jgi:hypothetical protein